MDPEIEASNNNWGENPYKPPIEEKIEVIPASPGKYIHIIYICFFIASMFAGAGIILNFLAFIVTGFVFATIAALLAFFEWV